MGIKIDKGNVHDVKLVEDTLPIPFIQIKNVIGDKGYISKNLKENLKINKNINLIYPYRNYNKSKAISKNGNKRFKKTNYMTNTPEEKSLLKKRHKIENFFSNLKKFRRISFIYERNIRNFEGFVYLAFLLSFVKRNIHLFI